jgi:hypothetical protein
MSDKQLDLQIFCPQKNETTDDRINKIIADICGWKSKIAGYWITPDGSDAFACDLPDYCNDLNAMHEAEKMLTEHQNESIYPRNLGAWRNPTKVICATARQRAEAFLKTLGKWEEVQR